MNIVKIICCGIVIINCFIGAISDDQKFINACYGVSIALLNYVILRSIL